MSELNFENHGKHRRHGIKIVRVQSFSDFVFSVVVMSSNHSMPTCVFRVTELMVTLM